MKRICNWKIFTSEVSLEDALRILKENKTIGGLSPVAIQNNKTGKFVEKYDESIKFSINELGKDWLILVPDNDEEYKNEKIRQMVKDSNCSKLTYDKIDNMTIAEIWQHISNQLDNNQKYRMLLHYYDAKIFKTK